MNNIKKLARQIFAASFEKVVIDFVKKMKTGEKYTYDICEVNPTVVQRVIKKLHDKGVMTYVSSGNMVVQKV